MNINLLRDFHSHLNFRSLQRGDKNVLVISYHALGFGYKILLWLHLLRA